MGTTERASASNGLRFRQDTPVDVPVVIDVTAERVVIGPRGYATAARAEPARAAGQSLDGSDVPAPHRRVTANVRIGRKDDVVDLPGIQMRDADNVLVFLVQHPKLATLVRDAREHISTIFGAGAEVVLEVFNDPEASIPSSQLVVVIRAPVSVRDAQERMRLLEDVWLLDALPRAKGALFVTIEPT